MINSSKHILRRMKKYIKNHKNRISFACAILALLAFYVGIERKSTLTYISASLLLLMAMIIESGIINVIMYFLLTVCLIITIIYPGRSSYNMPGYILLFIIGVSFIIESINFFNEIVNENMQEQKQERMYTVLLIVFLFGTGSTIYSVINLMHSIISLFYKWGVPKGEALTGVSLLITIATFSIGQFLKVQSDKKFRKQERQIALHKEINWRKELWNLEIKPEYNIQDLIKLNSFFNPKHNKAKNKKDEDIDVRLNVAIVNILSKYTCRNSVYFNKRENDKKENEPLVTLFDYSLTEDVINIKLNSEENQEIRELIHELLKVDWDRQTKY